MGEITRRWQGVNKSTSLVCRVCSSLLVDWHSPLKQREFDRYTEYVRVYFRRLQSCGCEIEDLNILIKFVVPVQVSYRRVEGDFLHDKRWFINSLFINSTPVKCGENMLNPNPIQQL